MNASIECISQVLQSKNSKGVITMKFFTSNKKINSGTLRTMVFALSFAVVVAETMKWVLPSGSDKAEEYSHDPCQALCVPQLQEATRSIIGSATNTLASLAKGDLFQELAQGISSAELIQTGMNILDFCGQEICAASNTMQTCFGNMSSAVGEQVSSIISVRSLIAPCLG